jgi:hypothetical protein
MVPGQTQLGFNASAPFGGFRWVVPQELRVRACKRWVGLKRARARTSPVDRQWGDQLLVRDVVPVIGPIAPTPRTKDNPTLFREFAGLDAASPSELLSFANTYGELGRSATVYCDPKGPCSKFYLADPEDTNPEDEKPACSMTVELHSDWVRHVVQMKTAVAVFDMLVADNQPDRKGLANLFRWLPVEFSEEVSERWVLDTRHGAPGVAPFPPDRFHSVVHVWQEGTRFDDVARVARRWLIDLVNKSLEGEASPRLVIDEKTDRVREELTPSDLLAVMWSQLFRAISGGKRYEQCLATGCGKWFEISNAQSGNTVRRRYCSDACRVREHRARQQETSQKAPSKKKRS